jgi:PAS domain-containing protein
MKDQSKTKQELIKEISILKNEIMGLKRTELEHKLAREAIQESETKLQAIFDIVGTGIMIIDRNTQIIKEANQTAIDMVGLPKESIIGQICHSLVCPAQEGKCPVKDLGQSVDQ